MTNRLEYIYSLIDQSCTGIADIGTDHGYLPIALASRGYKGNIYASDINSAPLILAKENAEKCGVSHRISFSLCDGLSQIPVQNIDTVVIAGMGGDTICSIIDNAEEFISSGLTFILQPMSKGEVLRYWLINNGFTISLDDWVEDNGRFFNIIKAGLSDSYSYYRDYELYTGKRDHCMNNDLYMKILQRQRRIFNGIVSDCSTNCSKTVFLKNYVSNMIADIDTVLEK